MANEFIARRGLIALEDSQITGNLSVSSDITGSEARLSSIMPSQGSIRIGYQAGQNVNSNAEVAIGYQALATHTGYSGIAIGYQAAANMTQPGDIVHIGYAAGTNAGTSGNTIFIGRDAGYNRVNSTNAIALGTRAMRNGSGNSIGIGNNALSFTTGNGNVAIGNQAGGLYNNSRTISDSVMIGDYAGRDNNGSKNVLVGNYAGQQGADFVNSTVIGYEAGYNLTGSNNVLLGYRAGYNLTGSNQLVIANNSSSALIEGDFANETVTINGSLNVTSSFAASGLNYPSADGTGGQVMVTDGAGNLSFDIPDAEKITFEVQNNESFTLEKGTPIHVVSMTGGTALVIAASASVASTMPSHGILNQQLTAGADGVATIIGQITGVNTSGFSAGDKVYVGASGGYTNVKPTGSANLIQNLGIVKKVDATNGTGEIFGSGRTNDVPNLPTGKIWVGSDTYTVTSSLITLDETGKKVTINASGSTVFEIVGSEGQLFSISDSLSGSLFAVSDVSGLPILEVFSDDTVKIGSFNNQAIIVNGTSAIVSGSFSGSFVGDGSGLTGIASVDITDLNTFTGSIQNEVDGLTAATSSYITEATDISSLNTFTGSIQTEVDNLTAATSSYLTSVPAGTVSSSAQIATDISGAFDSVSASLAAAIPTNNNQLTNGAGYTTNTGTVTEVTVGTGLDVTNGTTTPNVTLDLTEVIASDAANRVLTSDGDGTLTAESELTYDGTTLNVDGYVDIDADANGAAVVDITNTRNGTMTGDSYGLKVLGATTLYTGGTARRAFGGYFKAGQTTNAPDYHDTIALYAQADGYQSQGGPFSYAAIFSGSNGIVGINTMEPTVELDVVGDISASGNLVIGGIGNVSASLATIPTNNNQLTNGAGYTTNTGTVTVYGTTPTNGQIAVWRGATSIQAISGFDHDGASFKPTNVTFESGDTGTVYPSALQADGGVGDVVKLGSTTSMTTGDIYYWNGTSWSTATSANAATSSLLGIAAGASSATNGHIIRGIVQTGDTLTAGAPVYLIGTAGRVGPTAPTTSGQAVRVVGYALTTEEFYFNPSPDWFTIS